MAINKRKRKLSALNNRVVAAGDGRGDRPMRDAEVRSCTINNRLESMEERALADEIKRDYLQKKLNETYELEARSRKEVQELTDQLAKAKAEIQRHRWTILHNNNRHLHQQELDKQKADYEQQLAQLRQELAASEDDARNAWDTVTAQERDRRRMAVEMQQAVKAAEKSAAHHQQLHDLLHSNMQTLKKEHQSLVKSLNASAAANRKTARGNVDEEPAQKSRDAVRKHNDRLKGRLNEFLDSTLADGGAHGELAKAMMVTFFADNKDLLEHILTELQWYEEAERSTVEAIEERWTLDICTAIFIHGDLTFAGYQALINIMSKAYDFSDDTFKAISLPHGTEMPKLQSKNKLHMHLKEIAELFDMKPLEQGQGVSVNIHTLLSARLQLMRNLASEKHPLPGHVKV